MLWGHILRKITLIYFAYFLMGFNNFLFNEEHFSADYLENSISFADNKKLRLIAFGLYEIKCLFAAFALT